ALYGAARRGAVSTVAGLAGLGLLLRGLTDLEWRRLLGVGAGRRAIDLVKTINVAAPVERVYEFWSDYTRFPEFMANVRDVRGRGDGRTHWVVAGPAGVPVEWDAVETRRVPNEVLAWKTEPGSAVEHAGIVRFQRNRDGGTRVHVRMSYNPPAGALGHGVAALFGADPRSQMDADLARMKTLIETGNPPRDAAQPARDISSR
ncbi:MAG: SRPBCC family protein, partial [Candidatus Rokuibacteriota bacterium]